MDPAWFVYVLVAAAGDRTYVGVTTEIERRQAEHNGERPGGARTTTAGRPWRLGAAFGPFPDRSEAQRVEAEVKRLRGAARLAYEPDESGARLAVRQGRVVTPPRR